MRAILSGIVVLACAAGAALAQSNPPMKQAPPGHRGHPNTVAKDEPNTDALKSCLSQWEKSTHMSKQEWDRACRRVADRLQNLTIK
jgi:hypothetical protein